MARQIKRLGRWMLVLGPLVVLVMLLVPQPRPAQALTFSSPFWSNVSTNLECVCASACDSCGGPSLWDEYGVSGISGAYRHTFHLLDNPAKVGHFSIDVLWRSDISGHSQLGRGWILSFETTVQREILDAGNPWGANGNRAIVNGTDGLPRYHLWNGSAYAAQSCTDTDVLSLPTGTSGNYRLTDKHGGKIDFSSAGLPSVITDTRGNTTTLTYNSSKQVTELQDDRDFEYVFSQNADGFVEELDNPTHRIWTFEYDTAGNLTKIIAPATAQQTSGVTFEFGYDASNRMTSVKDGRGTTVKSIAYVGSTYQVDSITMDGDVVDYAYATGRIDRTNRLGHVHRTHYTGNKITQKDMWIASTATYVHTFSWGGDEYLAYEAFPRGNRIDYDWDASGNLLERRHKASNTSSTSSTDIVHTWTYTNNFAATYTDPLGNQTSYTRNAAGDVTQVTFPTVTSPATQTASRSYTYSSTTGQLTSATDEEGKVTNYHYFTAGDDIYLLEKVEVDPSGVDAETVYGYDGYWNVDSVTDPRGNTTTFTVDALRRKVEEVGPSTLYKIKWEYDGDGRVTKKQVQNRDKDNAVVTSNEWFDTTYTYTTLGDLASITEEINATTTRTTSFDHDDEQQRIRVTLPEGNKVKTEYNERGLVKKVIRGETSGVATDREFFYDDNGNLIEEEDGRNYDTTHTYDMFDRRTKSTNAQSAYTEWTLDKRGAATEIARKDSSHNVLLKQERFYDERGRLWKTEDLHKDPSATYSDAVTTITRLKTGHVSTVTDPRSKTITYTYDGAWRRTKVTDHAGNETSWTLDDNGNPTAWSIKDEDGASDVTHDYQATYDALNRRLTTVEIDRTNSSNTYTTTNSYDSRGNLVFQVNAEGNPTRWTYDGLSRMRDRDVALTVGTPITNFTSFVCTAWTFDKNDRLTVHEDDADNQTTWAYDACDRASTMTYPGGAQVVTYTYDAEDNVTQTLDSAGNDIDDTYDSLGRRTARTVTRATGFLDTTSETFSYDAADRMLTAEDNDYEVEFTYGVLGLASNVYEEKQSYATGTAYLKTVTRKYDAVGNKTYEAYPSGLALTYAWTDVNQLDTISDGTNTLANYGYAGLRRKDLVLGNSSKTVFSYSGFRGEVATIDHQDNASSTVLRLDYGYNKLHDRTYERYGSSGSAGDAFEYDKARRLTVAWMGSSTPSSPSGNTYTKKIEYNMDDDGNRTSVVVTPYGQSPATTSYTDNAYNQYTVVGGVSRSHDANGNVTDDGTYTYAYNYKNLIVKATRTSDSVVVGEYKYDALGRRVEKTVSGATYRYIYSGVEIVSVYTTTGTWKQDYVYGPTIDEVLMLEQADVLDWDADSNTTELARSWYRGNALGSVMRIEEPDRTEAVSYRYDPYGEVTITRGGSTQGSDPLGQYVTYTGRWRDEETGLYHYRARAYDPVRGRFLQRDPLGVVCDPSLYEYVDSNACSYGDPLGTYKFRPPPGDAAKAKKAGENAQKAGKKAGETLKGLLKKAIAGDSAAKGVFTGVSSHWNDPKKLEEALKLVEGFTEPNDLGPVLEGAQAFTGGQILPPGDERLRGDQECFRRGKLLLNLDRLVRDWETDEDSMWDTVWTWLHEFMHHALERTGNTEEADRNRAGDESGAAFERELRKYSGQGGGTSDAAHAKAVHQKAGN
jgi:RHS repeat-associated protein